MGTVRLKIISMDEVTDISKGNLEKIATKRHDMEIGNRYRIDAIKHLISISTAVLVFSVMFQKDVLSVTIADSYGKPLLLASWVFLFSSIFLGIVNLRIWAAFYISWSKDEKSEGGYRKRKRMTRQRRWSDRLQFLGLFCGLGLLVTFAWINIYPKPIASVQDSADQPATALESKPEGKETPEPETEGRSQ